MPSSPAVPSPSELHPTLCKVTERLARELASPSATAPDWSDYEWTVARAVAAMHGISPLLSRSLLWRGPGKWMTFLHEQRTHTRARHGRIRELLLSIDQKAREVGVAATALKGAALHQLGLYEAGDRPMADVDLLVRPADIERTAVLLASLGFRQSAQSWKERVFTPVEDSAAAEFGEHTANSLKIELHERICEKLPFYLTDISECIFASRPTAGLNDYPSKASLMRHLLLHAAGSMAFQGLRILQLHDIALLAGSMSNADWSEIHGSRAPHGRMWWAYPPLEMTSRYYEAVPKHVLAALKDECRLVLRALGTKKMLVDVSYSYLWVKAFPGIEWSKSIGELLGFAASRVRPNALHLAHRKQTAANETWAKQDEWSRMSQGRRMLRWLTSRQTRPVTMHSI
ncbi:MAG TPA: nucleotidyltransferase family protein, partial [Steroidobacteraceae bacterium]|nr:nucleotidyltransferase family protein [Steroidobacteraceae bacterium]